MTTTTTAAPPPMPAETPTVPPPPPLPVGYPVIAASASATCQAPNGAEADGTPIVFAGSPWSPSPRSVPPPHWPPGRSSRC